MPAVGEAAVGGVNNDSTWEMGFGFNNPKFSDRILSLQINPEPLEPRLGKRSREGAEKTDQPLPDHNTAISPRVTSLHVNSLVLASRSPFFYKMFSNGMRESEQHVVTLSVNASEEQPLIDLIQFLYKNSLQVDTPTDLLKVLLLADKYQIVSCVGYCVQMLSPMPMTFELAVSYINLPSGVSQVDSRLTLLVEAAKLFISKNFFLHYKAALNLPLESVENILSWDTLTLVSEDQVYVFVLRWAAAHYQDPKILRRVLHSRLCPLIRFPYMSYEALRTLVQSRSDGADVAKMVVDALVLKARNLHLSCPMRDYMLRPVKMMELKSPYQQCTVYMELNKGECKSRGIISAEPFSVGNEYLVSTYQRASRATLVLCAALQRSTSLKVKWEIAVMSKTTGEYKGKIISPTLANGVPCHFPVEPWDSFIGEDSKYFIDGVFYVRSTVILQQQK